MDVCHETIDFNGHMTNNENENNSICGGRHQVHSSRLNQPLIEAYPIHQNLRWENMRRERVQMERRSSVHHGKSSPIAAWLSDGQDSPEPVQLWALSKRNVVQSELGAGSTGDELDSWRDVTCCVIWHRSSCHLSKVSLDPRSLFSVLWRPLLSSH